MGLTTGSSTGVLSVLAVALAGASVVVGVGTVTGALAPGGRVGVGGRSMPGVWPGPAPGVGAGAVELCFVSSAHAPMESVRTRTAKRKAWRRWRDFR